jgi:hypothetical protein
MEAEVAGRKYCVQSTPVWLVGRGLIKALCRQRNLSALRSTPYSCRDDVDRSAARTYVKQRCMHVLRDILEQTQENGVAIGHVNIADLVLLKAMFASTLAQVLPGLGALAAYAPVVLFANV